MSLVVGIAVVGSCHRLLLALLLLTSPLVVGIAAVDRMVRMGRRGVVGTHGREKKHYSKKRKHLSHSNFWGLGGLIYMYPPPPRVVDVVLSALVTRGPPPPPPPASRHFLPARPPSKHIKQALQASRVQYRSLIVPSTYI